MVGKNFCIRNGFQWGCRMRQQDEENVSCEKGMK